MEKIYNFICKYHQKISLIFWWLPVLVLLSLFKPFEQKEYWELAWNLLLIIIFISPIAQITNSKILKRLLLYRRQLWITMGFLALVHVFLFYYNIWDFLYFLKKDFYVINWSPTFLFFWFIAILLIIPLLLTSNNLSMRILKRNWKKIQRLVYFVFILTWIHISILKWEDDFIGISIIIIFYLALKFIVYKKNNLK